MLASSLSRAALFSVTFVSSAFAQDSTGCLKPGSTQDLPGAQIAINPLESDTHMMVVRLGVTIGR